MKSKKRRGKAKKTKPSETNNPNLNQEMNDNEGSAFDFGGLPERDLKKNLGCG